MKEQFVTHFCCPGCRGNIKLQTSISDNGEVKEGRLVCSACGSIYPVANYIPRFVPAENYAGSFGYQWNRHVQVQIDRFSNLNISKDRFFSVTQWPEDMQGQLILEAGCGAGRFTQVAISTGAQVFSFDYSNSVDANLQNNELPQNLCLFQADIFNIPLSYKKFDKVFCLGVLQHTPDVKGAFMSLLPYLKDGGEIVIDVYNRPWYNPLIPRYVVRFLFGPITRRMKPNTLHKVVERIVLVLLPVKIFLRKIPLIGRYVSYLIPVASLELLPQLTKEQRLELSILDTFDMISPRYDTPQRINDVRDWFVEAGLTDIEIKYGPNGINAKGTKRALTDSR